jgi:xylulokinase
MYLLGIDLGTTGCKSMLFDEKGGIFGSDYIEYGLIMTEEGIEQDALVWWENVKASIRHTLHESGVPREEVAALAVSSQGISFLPVDRNGAPLMNAITWLDGRSTAEIARIRETLDEAEVFARTGKRLLPYVLPQLMWIKGNCPDIYRKAHKFLMAHDYIVYRLTGRFVTDLSMASGTLLYDIREQDWIAGYAEKFGIDTGLLPGLGVVGDPVGCLLPEAAKDLGLTEKTQVVIGAQDQRCASIGAGIREGVFTASLGTASAMCAICKEPLTDLEQKVTCCGLDRSNWILETVIGTSGMALKWLKNTLFKGSSYGELDEMAARAKPGSAGVMFFPHLYKDTTDAKGAFIGLSLQAETGDIVRAVLEGIAFQMKLHLSDMERIGASGRELRLFGGGARGDVWCQIIADVTGKKVVVPRTHETANLGAAMIAGIGCGFFHSYEEAVAAMAGVSSRTYLPNIGNRALYDVAFDTYSRRNDEILES